MAPQAPRPDQWHPNGEPRPFSDLEEVIGHHRRQEEYHRMTAERFEIMKESSEQNTSPRAGEQD